LSASGGLPTLYLTNTYVKTPQFSRRKAKPNKPKQTQSDPRFSPLSDPRTKSKAKQTQPVAAKPACRGEVLYEAGWRSRIDQPPRPYQSVVSPSNLFVAGVTTVETSRIQRYYGQSRAFQRKGVLLIELDGKFRRELRCWQVWKIDATTYISI
jgi:hypothetical protein